MGRAVSGAPGLSTGRQPIGEHYMTPLAVVLADIAALEAARDALPNNSHIAALFSLTVYRLEEEAHAMRRAKRPARLPHAAESHGDRLAVHAPGSIAA